MNANAKIELVPYYASIDGLRFDDGAVAWIQQDPEGNGPGHLALEKPMEDE